MKPSLLRFALFLGLGFLAAAYAAPLDAGKKLAALDRLLGLAGRQRAEALDLFQKENDQLEAIPASDRPREGSAVRQATRAGIRALLTPEQLRKYDRTPQLEGGGLSLPQPKDKVARLEHQVGALSAAQRNVALDIYTEEFESLLALPDQERFEKGAVYRQAAQQQIETVLTPEQQAKRKALRAGELARLKEERAVAEEALRASPAVAAQVGMLTDVTPTLASTEQVDDGPRSGQQVFAVTGANGQKTVTVNWKRAGNDGRPVAGKIEIADRKP